MPASFDEDGTSIHMERAPCEGRLGDWHRRRVRPCGVRRCSIRWRSCQRGAAIVEAVVALPILLAVILGTIQFGFIHEAKAVLNHAVLQAARAGAVSNAEPDAIRRGLARGLAPLYLQGSSLQDVATAVARLNTQLRSDAQIRILNPTHEAFDDFAVKVDGLRQIPNDRLHMRSTGIGERSGLNIQDANLLRVQVTYGYELKVPLVDWFISRALLRIRRALGNLSPFEQQLLARTRLPIVATSTVRMQSPARLSDVVVRRSELPELKRVPVDAPAPAETDSGSTEDSGNSDGDHGSNLADAFLGYGVGSAQGGGPGVDGVDDGSDDGRGSDGRDDDEGGGADDDGNGGSDSGGGAGSDTGGNGGSGGNAGDPGACDADGNHRSDASIATGAPSLSIGNPIHVATGNKYQAEIDLAPLPGLLGIAFTRHYNSQAADAAGVMGAGWRHSYEASIRQSADAGSIELRQADGRHLTFTRSAETSVFVGQRGSDGVVWRDDAGFRWLWPTGRELRFDSRGRLISMREGAAVLTLAYDPSGRLASVIDSQRRTLRFEYGLNGRVSEIRSVAGAAWRYHYDERGNLVQVVSSDGRARRYAYADARHSHHLTGISAGRVGPVSYGSGNSFEAVAEWNYDSEGRAVLSSHPGGADRVTLRYGDGYTDVINAFGRVTRFVVTRRDGIALVTEVRGPGCGTCGEGDVAYSYDEHFQLTRIARKGQPVLSYRYDRRQRLIAVERGSGATKQWLIRYGYKESSQPTRIEIPSVNDDDVHAFEFDYGADGRLLAIRESGYSPTPAGHFQAIGRAWKFSYDANGKLIELDGPRTEVRDVTRFQHDSLGRLRALLPPDGTQQRIGEYDAAGRPVLLEETERPAVRLEYDLSGRVIAISQLRGGLAPIAAESPHAPVDAIQVSRFSYDALGRLREWITPDGAVRRIRYNMAGKPDRYLDLASGRSLTLAYAPDGKLSHAAMLAPSQIPIRTLYYAYDSRRRLTEVRDGQGPPLRQLSYLDDGALPARVVDSTNRVAQLDYDPAGNVRTLLKNGEASTRFAWDLARRLTAVTAPNDARTRYDYDDFGRRVREESADRGATSYRYDAADNLKERTDARGEKTMLFYDAANRLVRVERREGATQLRYEGAHLVQVAGPSSQERFHYDANGQLIRHAWRVQGHVFAVGYRYGPDGRLSERILPSGRKLEYRRADSVTHPDPVIVQAGLFKDRWIYDGRQSIGRSGRLEYDNAGRVVAVADGETHRSTLADGSAGPSYRYDEAGRLQWARSALGESDYRYDANGNRLSATVGASTERYVYAPRSNRLIAVRGRHETAYSYDAAGSPLRIANRRYEYDGSGRVTGLHIDGRLAATYRYGPSGDRVSKTVYAGSKPTTTFFIYENHQLIAEADGQGRIVREYLYRGHRPIAMWERGTLYRIASDPLGAPTAMTNEAGHMVWRARYGPFGAAEVEEDPDGDGKVVTLNLRFPGQYADAESSTYYNIMRDYDPRTGRYLTSDPLGLAGGLNSFGYAGQDPVNAIDPLGLYLFAFDGTWINRSSGTLTNVELFRRYYDPSFNEARSYYRRGLGTQDPQHDDFQNSVDRVLGGAFGLGGQATIDDALNHLDNLIAGRLDKAPFDGVIDLVGFSRGAAIARAFANRIYERIDAGYYRNALAGSGLCRSLRIRFMGLFDSVGSFGLPGNSVDAGYDFSIDERIGTVAHAVALDEHRAAFDLLSIQSNEHSPDTTAYREERGFIGAHSDIGGGYSVGDLSDIALQWMYKKAVAAGVGMTPLHTEHLAVSAPILHDERALAQDREIFYPNDPAWQSASCTNPIQCLFWEPPATQRQSTAPQFQLPELLEMIRENPQPGSVRGTVDLQRYRSWLRSRGQI